MPVFLADAARALLILHAVAGFAAVGATTHLAIYSVGVWLRRESWSRPARRFGLLVPILITLPILIGLLIYPSYKVNVRMAYLDAQHPAVVALFDLKEHMAAIALPLVLAASAIARWPGAKNLRWMAAPLAVAGAALVWIVALAGIYVTSFKSVGAP